MGKLDTVITAATQIIGVVTNEDLRKTVLGTYSDGKPRSIIDAYNGEVLSPKQKQKKLYKKRKSGKKKIKL